MSLRGRQRPEVQLDLTALIDVVFILVIFVVLAASFERIRELTVDLPEAQGSRAAAADALRIVVPVQGDLTVGGRAVAEADLKEALQSSRGHDRPVQLFVAAGARVDRAVRVLDAVRAAGFSTVGVVTREPAE